MKKASCSQDAFFMLYCLNLLFIILYALLYFLRPKVVCYFAKAYLMFEMAKPFNSL